MSNPKTIYVLTKGEYSDYGIFAMFSTREKAEKCQCEMKMIRGGYSDINDGVDEWELDSIPELNGDMIYEVLLGVADGNGEARVIDSISRVARVGQCQVEDVTKWLTPNVKEWMGDKVFRTWCIAEDEKHALKIASERMSQEKALNRI